MKHLHDMCGKLQKKKKFKIIAGFRFVVRQE